MPVTMPDPETACSLLTQHPPDRHLRGPKETRLSSLRDCQIAEYFLTTRALRLSCWTWRGRTIPIRGPG
jgi:hypothetical protein